MTDTTQPESPPESPTTAFTAVAAAFASFSLAAQHVAHLRRRDPPHLRRSGRLAAQAALLSAKAQIDHAVSLLCAETAAESEPVAPPPAPSPASE